MATQLEIQQAMNKALGVRNELLKEQSRLVKSQLADTLGLKQAWSEIDPDLNDILGTIKKTRAALDDAAESFEESEHAGESFGETIARELSKSRKAADSFKVVVNKIEERFPKLAAVSMGFIDGLIQGFKFAWNVMKSGLDVVFSIGKAFKDIGFSILSIPFKMLDGLIAASNKLLPIMEATARAIEDVRKGFGDIATGTGKEIIDTAHNVGIGFEKMGLSGYAIFGSLDERIQAVNKLAQGLGANIDNFSKELKESGGAIMLFQKGLGLTDETMGGLTKRAKSMGTTFTTQLKEITKFSVDFGKKFGVSQKLISKDMGTMAVDVKHFANLAPKELAKVSVYARKLGLDVKDLLGVIDKFDTFESAAESSAQLSQAFGVQTDAIALMKAENPADRVDTLRKSFLSAGKSADQLSRQELKLLSQTTGLGEEAVKAAFSQKNLGISMQELSKQGIISEKKTRTTEEAIGDLQSSIERIIKPFKQFTSFIKSFVDGFARGLLGSENFRDLLVTIHKALRETYAIGMKVGQAFANMFPGLKDLIVNFKSFFKVTDGFKPFGTMINTVSGAFTDFFDSIKNGPDAVIQLFKDLKKGFNSFTTAILGNTNTRAMEEFATATGNVIAGVIKTFSLGAIKIMEVITNILTGKELPKDIPGDGIAAALINPLVKEFEDPNGPLKQIIPAFLKMVGGIWSKYKEPITKAVQPIALGFVGVMFGSAFIKAAGALLITSLSEMFMGKLISWVKGPGGSILESAGSSIGATLVEFITSPFIAIPLAIAAVLGTSVAISKGMDQFNENLRKKFGETESMVGASTAGIIDVITLGLLPDSLVEKVGEFAASAAEMIFRTIEKLPFGDSVSSMLQTYVKSSIEVLKSLGDLVLAIFDGNTEDITKKASAFGEKIMSFVATGFSTIMSILPTLIKATASAALVGLQKAAALIITEFIPWVLKGASKLAQVILGVINGVFVKVGDWIGKIPIIGAVLGPMFTLIGNIIGKFATSFGMLADFFGQAVKKAELFRTLVVESFTDLANVIADKADHIWSSIKEAFGISRAESLISNWVSTFDKELKENVQMFANWIEDGVTSLMKWLGIASPSKKAMEIGSFFVQGFLDGLSNLGELIKKPFSLAIDSIKDVLGFGPDSKNVKIGSGIADSLEAGLKAVPNIIENVTSSGLSAVDAMTKLGDMTTDLLKTPFMSLESIALRSPATSPVVKAISAMVDEANAIETSLATMSQPFDIDARLEALGKDLGLKDKTFRVERKNIQLNLNLNVNIEAEKLANVLKDQGKFVLTDSTTRK